MIESLRRRITEIEEHSGISLMVETATLKALLDAMDVLSWYADEDNYDPESGAPGQWPYDPDEGDFESDNGERARAALAALEQDGAS